MSLDSSALKGVSVLVVDDAVDTLALMKKMLEYAGAEVQVAGDGAAAVEMATAGEFDVVLMDIQMPTMDGREATRKLRRLGYTKPILALTASAVGAEQERCLAAGCNQCLSKPVPRQHLVETVGAFASR